MPFEAKTYGGYGRDSPEALNNSQIIYNILGAQGWTLNAVCGLLGNIGYESGYNPFRWQGDKIGESDGYPWRNKGYGFVQFTPASKYISDSRAMSLTGYAPNFLDKSGNVNDGIAQILYIHKYADYYKTGKYDLSYSEFKKSVETPSYLASAWLYNYERPGDPVATEKIRQENSEFWYDKLKNDPEPPPEPPEPPTPTPPTPPILEKKKKIPLYMITRKPWM